MKGLEEEYKLFPECIQLFAQERLAAVKNEIEKNNFLFQKFIIIRALLSRTDGTLCVCLTQLTGHSIPGNANGCRISSGGSK